MCKQGRVERVVPHRSPHLFVLTASLYCIVLWDCNAYTESGYLYLQLYIHKPYLDQHLSNQDRNITQKIYISFICLKIMAWNEVPFLPFIVLTLFLLWLCVFVRDINELSITYVSQQNKRSALCKVEGYCLQISAIQMRYIYIQTLGALLLSQLLMPLSI